MKKSILRIAITTLFAFSAITLWQSLDFDDMLFVWSNSGMQENYEHLWFQYGGNTFPGMVFLKQPQTVAPVNITLNGETIAGCTTKIAGAYYNPARGNRLRPLDQDTLDEFQSIDASYNNLTFNGWLYTNCTGEHPEAIYGYIQHTREQTNFDLIAGARMHTDTNTYSNVFDHTFTLDSDELSVNGYLYDPLGGIAKVWLWPIIIWAPICWNGIIETGEMCDDGDIINGDGCSNTCQVESGWVCSGEPSVCIEIDTPETDRWTAWFNARLQFPSLYTNTPFVNWLIYMTEPVWYIIHGDTTNMFAGTLNQTAYTDIVLTANEWTKTLTTTFTSIASGIVITGSTQIILDLTDPTLTITAPASGATIDEIVNASWIAQDSNGIATTWIQVHQNNNLVYSNNTTDNSYTITTLADGTYTVTITVYDRAGNSTTQTVPFTVAWSTIPSNRSITGFTHITAAQLNTVYTSSPIIIAGLPTGTSVTGTINTGTLIKNGIDVWTGASFANGDIIKIALKSATTYNTTQTAQLNIHNTVIPFNITTQVSSDDETQEPWYCLSNNQYALIFLSMQNMYEGNHTKFKKVLALMLLMMNDMIIMTANQWWGLEMYALQCFADIIDNYLTTSNSWPEIEDDIWIYTAPNGKQYLVEYLDDIDGYTSPDFMYPKIFVTYQTFTAHIDINNPQTNTRNHTIDPSFTPVVHTAPNNKVYTIQKTNKWFMSYQFIVPAYFQTLEWTKAHINRHNPQ